MASTVYIVDIWDTRMSPEKLSQRIKKRTPLSLLVLTKNRSDIAAAPVLGLTKSVPTESISFYYYFHTSVANHDDADFTAMERS